MSGTGKPLYRLTHPHDDLWRVIWDGDFVDAHPAEKAENLFLELNRNESFHAGSNVEIDLTNCGIVNSAGIAFLIYMRRRLQTNGNRWALSNMPLLLQRMVRMLNLESAFEVLSRHTIDSGDDEVLVEGLDPDFREEGEAPKLTVNGPIHTHHAGES